MKDCTNPSSVRKRLEVSLAWTYCLLLLAGCGDVVIDEQAPRAEVADPVPAQSAVQPVASSHGRPQTAPPPTAAAQTTAQPPTPSSVPEWGDLRARFVFDGPPPERKRIQVTADIEFCGKQNLYEEKLVVNSTNAGIANVVAWLVTSTRDSPPPVRSIDEPAVAEVKLDAQGCRFEPHVTLLRTNQTLVIRNVNPIGDSAKIDTLSNPGLNILLPAEGQVRYQFPMPERLPAQVSCTVHPWEIGWLVVQAHPYMAVSDGDGNLQVKDIPTGKWTFQFWHETAGYITQARIGGELRNLSRGRLELDITAGPNDLGEVRLAPQLFQN